MPFKDKIVPIWNNCSMAGKPKSVCVTQEQERQLRQLENDPTLPLQTRHRAQMVRMTAQGFERWQIAQYVGVHPQTVKRTCQRFRQEGVSGLHEKPRAGKPSAWNAQIEQFVHTCLAQDQAWDCVRLSEAIGAQFQIEFHREVIRGRLQSMGYTWQRTRYGPIQKPDPEAVQTAQEFLEWFKRGRMRGWYTYCTWTKRAAV
jgi:transposase